MVINREYITHGPIVNYEKVEYEDSIQWEILKGMIGKVICDNCVPGLKSKILNVDWNGRVLLEIVKTGRTYVTGVRHAARMADV